MNTFVYISGWDKRAEPGGRYGLTAYRLLPDGGLSFVETAEPDTLFNVACFDARRGLLYALEEVNDLPGLRGGGGGRIFAFRPDRETGRLETVGSAPTWCPSPCHLSFSADGERLLVAHQGSYAAVTKLGRDAYGNFYPVVERDDVAVELFSIGADGVPDRLLDADLCRGEGPERRQIHARPHTVVRSPDGTMFAVCDKGNDTVGMYAVSPDGARLIPPRHVYRCRPGLLPRYCVFHPTAPWFFLNTESDDRIYAFRYDAEGALTPLTSVAAAPGAPLRERMTEQQGLVMSADGRFLYDVVRGPNAVSVLAVDAATGVPETVQVLPVAGAWPRGCALSPDGRLLLVCCRDSGTVERFAVGEDGLLAPLGEPVKNPAAAFAVFCEL